MDPIIINDAFKSLGWCDDDFDGDDVDDEDVRLFGCMFLSATGSGNINCGELPWLLCNDGLLKGPGYLVGR